MSFVIYFCRERFPRTLDAVVAAAAIAIARRRCSSVIYSGLLTRVFVVAIRFDIRPLRFSRPEWIFRDLGPIVVAAVVRLFLRLLLLLRSRLQRPAIAFFPSFREWILRYFHNRFFRYFNTILASTTAAAARWR